MPARQAATKPIQPKAAPGSHGEGVTRALPPEAPGQLALVYDREVERENDEKALRDMFRLAVNAFGGADALRAELGEAPSYLSKISEAMVGERPVQGRWLIPLLACKKAGPIVANWINRRAGFAAPAPTRVVTREQIAEALLAVVLENPMLWSATRPEIAHRLNVDVEDVQP